MSIYKFKLIANDGTEFYLPRNKVLLIVNVASKCGFTKQYKGLQHLHEKYPELEIIAFPCNSFGGQEPGSDDEIKEFCETNFHVTFPIMQKTKVNGKDSEPLFNYLKEHAKGILGTERIKWNFTKFLVSKDGKTVQRYAPKTIPEDIIPDIENFLKD
ncbi:MULTISPECIES: glutathione peroxidase [unclassified Francisella]|uniref:glutathione peroxidase n=1 Tax=unclassified Francisella TaxID=2610885 RepID=UPI002E3178E7|nr:MULTISPECIES: glutathione peroxidase [unclassified Francisella]MED7819700.1 glutathione peroxidase [Francisella sp. 19S2-4]MED7830535.1 glutathione peroxidase [Francisella sp. 19S2-10]